MENINDDDVIINMNKEQDDSKKHKIIFSCFRIGDSSSKAFVIRISSDNQIYSIKEYISKSFEPKIIPRYLKLYVPVSSEIFPDNPALASAKKFNQAKKEGIIDVIELAKPLKKISDELCLCNRIKNNPEALDIIILDDNLQRSIDAFASTSLADISFGNNNRAGGEMNSISKERLVQNNGSTSNFLSYDSRIDLYSKRKNSKMMKTIKKVEGKVHIKNNKIKIPVLIISSILIIAIVGFIWYPRNNGN